MFIIRLIPINTHSLLIVFYFVGEISHKYLSLKTDLLFRSLMTFSQYCDDQTTVKINANIYVGKSIQLVVSMDSFPTCPAVVFFVLCAKLLLQPSSTRTSDGRLSCVSASALNSCSNVSASPCVAVKTQRKAFKLRQVMGRSGNKPPKVHSQVYSTRC